MRASTETLLSLFEWGELMGVNPWELAQYGAGFPEGDGRQPQCPNVFFQYQWQQDALSREEIASAIERAEAAVAEQLHYWPAPKFLQKTVSYPQALFGGWNLRDGFWSLQVDYGKVIGGGRLARTIISADAAVAISDGDGDNLNETFTVTLATSVTHPDEIALYYRAVDRDSQAIDETWRIRPVQVSISGGTATIRGHRSLLAPPMKTQSYQPGVLNVADETDRVTSVEVYRVYRDTTATDSTPAQGDIFWDGRPTGYCSGPTSPTTHAIQVRERYVEAARIYFTVPVDSSCVDWGNPDRVSVNYLAGVPREAGTGRMARAYADIVAHLATAWLPEEMCGCERSQKIIAYWRGLPNESDNPDDRRPLTFKEVDNPFGPERGALWAWKRVQTLQRVGAFAL